MAHEISTEADTSPEAAQGRVGQWLNRQWRLDSVLGVGGSAAVYEATHRDGRRAAIKLLHAEYAFHPRLRARLIREARVLGAQHHPSAVRLIDQDVTSFGEQFLVMERLDGETLAEYLIRKRARLPLEQSLRITLHVLDAVVAAHEAGVVHRDLSVENVFITRSRQIKLIDFGISRLIAEPELYEQDLPIMGTPGFMSPEQARGQCAEVDAQSDIWAVGAILFEMLTGMPVHYEAGTLPQQLLSAAWRPAPQLATITKGASPELQAFVERALAFEKCDRFPDAESMREELLCLFVLLPEAEGERALPVSVAPRAPADTPPAVAARRGGIRELGRKLLRLWHAVLQRGNAQSLTRLAR